MSSPSQKSRFKRVQQRRRFPWMLGIVVSIAFLAILVFVIVTLVILQSQGISQGINILTIISIVGSFMIGIFGLLLSFLQWHHARLSSQHQQTHSSYPQTITPDDAGHPPTLSTQVGPPQQYKESNVGLLPHQSQRSHQIDSRKAPYSEQLYGGDRELAKFWTEPL